MMRIAYLASDSGPIKKLSKKEKDLELARLITARLQPAADRLAKAIIKADREYHGDDWPL